MGQKVHAESLRVGYIHDWKSNWFNERHFAEYLHEDTQIRRHIVGKLVVDVRADLYVLVQVVRELALVEPVGLPVVDVAHAQRLGVNLLAHG